MKSKVLSILALLLVAATGAMAQSTYNITLADGTEDANWTITPSSAEEGETVTITYTGTKKVKSVKAVKKAAAPAARTLAEATAEDLGKIAGADGNIYDTEDAATTAGIAAVAMIAYVGSETDHATYTHGLALALADESSSSNGWSTAKSTCESKSAVSGAAWLLPSQNQWKAMFKAFGDNDASYSGLNTKLATAGGDSSKLQESGWYWSSTEYDDDYAWYVLLDNGRADWNEHNKLFDDRVRACLAF